MSKEREALNWEPIREFWRNNSGVNWDELEAAIKEALAQPGQEPVGKFAKFSDGLWKEVTKGSAGVLLYTTPPQRTWVGLTQEDIFGIADKCGLASVDWTDVMHAVEAKLKEKNSG